jgi:hypothetical protein
MYSNFSVSFLEVISYWPAFKEKKENEVFDLDVDGRLFKIRAFSPPMARKLNYMIDDETFTAKDFFQLASYCLNQFEEKITDL